VKKYGKYRRKLWNDMENMEEKREMIWTIMEEYSEKVTKI
jgi:hypothetical protein